MDPEAYLDHSVVQDQAVSVCHLFSDHCRVVSVHLLDLDRLMEAVTAPAADIAMIRVRASVTTTIRDRALPTTVIAEAFSVSMTANAIIPPAIVKAPPAPGTAVIVKVSPAPAATVKAFRAPGTAAIVQKALSVLETIELPLLLTDNESFKFINKALRKLLKLLSFILEIKYF